MRPLTSTEVEAASSAAQRARALRLATAYGGDPAYWLRLLYEGRLK